MAFTVRTPHVLPRRRRRGPRPAAALAAIAGLLAPSLAGAGGALREVWLPTGEVNFYIADDTEVSRAAITYAMNYLSAHTPLDIEEANDSQANLRFESTGQAPDWGGYTYFYWDPNRDDENQKIRFDPSRRPTSAVVAHEFGHALGFAHEFQRDDRGAFVDVCSRPFDPYNYAPLGAPVYPWYLRPHANLSPYDYASVMNDGYSHCVTPLGPFQQTRSYPDATSVMLSRDDINSIYRMYGVPLAHNSQGDRFGASVASGDYDDDGLEDVVVALVEFNELWLLFYRGVGSDWDSTQFRDLKWVPWFKEQLESGVDRTARVTLATGDFNGDGIADLAVGQPDYDSNRGRVSILFVNSWPSDPAKVGSEADFAPWGRKGIQHRVDIGPEDVGLGTQVSHEFGAALAAVRATNFRDGDGDIIYHDLVIGAPRAAVVDEPWDADPRRPLRNPAPNVSDVPTRGAIAIVEGRYDPSPANFSIATHVLVWNPSLTDDEFGAAVAPVPGRCNSSPEQTPKYYTDFIAVGAPGHAGHDGAAYIYGCATTGSSSSLIRPSREASLRGFIPGGRFGEALAGFQVFDGNATRTSYLVVGQPEYEASDGLRVGRVLLYEAEERPTFVTSVVPAVHDGGDDFGQALAVHQQAVSVEVPDEGGSLVYIGIGMPGAVVDGVRAGEVHVWRPFQSASTTQVINAVDPDASANARFGAHIAMLRPLQSAGGFVAAAPNAIVDGVEAGQVSTLQNPNRDGTWAAVRYNLDQETEGDLRPTNR